MKKAKGKFKTIKFNFNAQKAVQVILWVASKAPNKKIDIYKILKTLFEADVYHLNKYGRLICGDSYKALKFGTVPDDTYEILKGEPLAIEEAVPVSNEPPYLKFDGYMIEAKKSPNLELLSESDVEALDHGWDICKDLTFEQMKNMTHKHPAYQNAWNNRGLINNPPINLADFFEDKNNQNIEELVKYSRFARI